jgi:hypothetical protein
MTYISKQAINEEKSNERTQATTKGRKRERAEPMPTSKQATNKKLEN